MNLIKKVKKIMMERPEELFAHIRGVYLFYQTYIIRKWIFRYHKNIVVENNVRLQSIKNVSRSDNGKIFIGENSIVYENAQIGAYDNGDIKIGKNSIIGDTKIFSRDRIYIGDCFLTSWNVLIQDFDPHPVQGEKRKEQVEFMCNQFYPKFNAQKNILNYNNFFVSESITIGNNVWVGANSTILKGAKIGNNCIVATGSVVVAGVYPNNAILAGNPAKVVKITE